MSKRNLFFTLIFTSSILLFVLVTVIGWHLIPNGHWGLYTLTDGAWVAWFSKSILTWTMPFDLSLYSFMQGLGSLYPPNMPWLSPGALALSIPGKLSTQYYLSYLIYLLELLAATIVLGRSLGLSLAKATVVAQLLCLIIFPPYASYFLTLPWTSIGPLIAHLLSMAAILLALFHALGRAGTRNNILIVLGMTVALACGFYTAAVFSTTFVPVYALFGFAVLIHEPNAASVRWKVGTIAGLLLLSYLLGIPEYYLGTARVTSSDLLTSGPSTAIGIETLRNFIKEWHAFNWCDYPQAFLCSDYPIVYFHAAAFAGAAVSVAIGRGLERRLAFAMVLLLVVIHVWPIAARAGLLGKFTRISPIYFLFSAYPFYAFFVVLLFGHIARAAGSALRWLAGVVRKIPSLKHAQSRSVSSMWRITGVFRNDTSMLEWGWLLIVPSASIWILYTIHEPRLDAFKKTWSLPRAAVEQPIGNIITETLEHEIGLQPGATFKGFATTYFGSREGALRAKLGFDRDAPFSPEMYIDSRFYMQAVYGNSFMTTDLWGLNIPTLNEYGQWITKPFYVFAKEMFATEQDKFALHEINLYLLNPKFLQALGVRFVISDAAVNDPRFRLRATLRPDPAIQPVRPGIAGYSKSQSQILAAPLLPVFLYEISGSNLATFSPTKVRYVPLAGDILQALKDEKFDPSTEVIVSDQLPDSQYYPATGSSLAVYRGHLRVKARSDGTSVLLLPFQFSRCLRVESHLRDNDTAPRLTRANLVQSAIVFKRELDADLTFVFGPGRDVSCRQADVADYQRLDFTRWSENAPYLAR